MLYVAGISVDPRRYGIPDEYACAGIPGTFSGLLRVSAEYEIESDWAESWEPREDGARWVFHLRQNSAGWTDESSVTAEDFVRAWRRLLEPESPSRLAWFLFDIENAREIWLGELPPDDLGVEAIDEWTLEVRLQRPRVSFLALAAIPLLSPFTGPASAQADAGDAPECVSNGPYRLEDREGDALTLTPHEGYWDADTVSLDRVEVEDPASSVAINDFRQSRLDFMPVENSDLARVRADVNLSSELERGVATQVWCLIPQVDFPPFEDARVRRALGQMIDRRRLEQIVEGRVSEATTLFPDGFLAWLDDFSPEIQYDFDIDAALEEIGETAFADPFVWPAFTLTIPAGDPTREQVARDVVAQLYENLGLDVPVEAIEPAEFDAGMRERRYPLAWVEWTYRYPDPSCGYCDLFASWTHPERPIVWENDEYDDLVRLADTLVNPAQRAEVYARCEELLQEQGIYIPLVYPVEHYLVQPWVVDRPTNSRGRLTPPGPIYSRFATSLTVTERPDSG